ncbi:MAG: UDP-N-acetylglucosamine 2-epimerase (non-hydrolyzing) [Deltaproteobacteria bacterium]|nr:UDP-N-acetylglucosamine 2-epimerase (non-hydrolyzing) [Deltaproteobacteria bacterium]
MKIVTIVGARPQFIKAAPVTKALREAGHTEFLLHTGQHYDYGMSKIFFEEMGIPEPDVNLAVGSGTQGWQTGKMLMGIEEVLLAEKPDWVLVYGDTNSTLAGALAAVKLHMPVSHVEAGLRSFNREMPEEHNRLLTDHCSELLFCPTQTAVDNLASEGIRHGVHLVGDTMHDAVLQYAAVASERSRILQDLGLNPKGYLLATIHRPYNTDIAGNLENILRAFEEIGERVVFPVHPRTRQKVVELDVQFRTGQRSGDIKIIEPVGYLDMLMLEKNARVILTDSGGMQKEAYFFGVPCVTLRPETEWVELVQLGYNKLAGADVRDICDAYEAMIGVEVENASLYGDGSAGQKIVEVLSA